MKCGRICLSQGSQLPVLHRRKESQHFMNQAKFHSRFPILLLLKSLDLLSCDGRTDYIQAGKDILNIFLKMYIL